MEGIQDTHEETFDGGIASMSEFEADILAQRNGGTPPVSETPADTTPTAAPEAQTETPATTQEQAAPEAAPAATEPPAAEPPLPKVEFAPPPTPAPQQQELSLEDLVNKVQDKTALLKALGLDEYAIGAVQYYQQTGDLTPYLEVKSVDYSKFSEQALVERKLREQYATHGFSDEEMQLLIEDELSTRYKQNPELYSEKEMQLGKIRMKADAATYRNEFMERQKKFAPPPPPQQEAQSVPEQPSYEEMVAANEQRVLADTQIQQFVKQPVIKIGDGELAFNYESKNPKALLSVMTDPQQFTYHTSKKDELGRIVTDAYGNPVPDYSFLLELAAHITDRSNYNTLLTKHGKSLGTKAIAEEINPEQPLGGGNIPIATPPDEHTFIAQALKGYQ